MGIVSAWLHNDAEERKVPSGDAQMTVSEYHVNCVAGKKRYHSPLCAITLSLANASFEDTHAEAVHPGSEKEGGGYALFGVYDGHSGTAASAFARDELFGFIRHELRSEWQRAKDRGIGHPKSAVGRKLSR